VRQVLLALGTDFKVACKFTRGIVELAGFNDISFTKHFSGATGKGGQTDETGVLVALLGELECKAVSSCACRAPLRKSHKSPVIVLGKKQR